MTDNIILCYDEENYTVSVDLQNAEEDIIDIPSFIEVNQHDYTVIEVLNINKKNISISKYLRNKYKGKNISYKEDDVPINWTYVQLQYSLDDLNKYPDLTYNMACAEIRKYYQYKNLEYLSKVMLFNSDRELMEACIKYINSPSGFDWSTRKILGLKDIMKNLINPNYEYLKDIYDLSVKNKTQKAEFNIYFFKLYCDNYNKLISSEYWDKNLSDLYIYAYSEFRGF